MTSTAFLAVLADADALLWSHARRMARGRTATAEDLHQHAVTVLWAERHKAADHPNPSGWFVQCGRWAMLRHLREQGKHLAGELDAHASALAAFDADPDEFTTLVGLVPDCYRDLLDRRFRGGEVLADIAADAGVTPGAVRRQIDTALDHLRRHLAG